MSEENKLEQYLDERNRREARQLAKLLIEIDRIGIEVVQLAIERFLEKRGNPELGKVECFRSTAGPVIDILVSSTTNDSLSALSGGVDRNSV
ncbi:hypothetical protein [Roseibium sp. MMSF_3544]|uniref:hypothetical protein n=1 Tax=unclassified Roseibium TaxID=2629323 RepID=UPI00273CF8CC|nr:hypothetical protein [Roseibium sp. MMSF_3544]